MKRMILVTILLLVLTACTEPQAQGTSDPVATEMPQANMPNPASVYCEQNGNTLEIDTAADGSQSGRCVFPDGSACEEWAYYRGECGPATQTSTTPAITLEAATVVNAGTEDQPSGGYMPSGTSEEITDWWGVIKSTEPGAQFDDYFERQDLGQSISFGVDSRDPAVQSQIEALRDSGRIVHIFGTLVSNMPDYNGSQILVERMEFEE